MLVTRRLEALLLTPPGLILAGAPLLVFLYAPDVDPAPSPPEEG